ELEISAPAGEGWLFLVDDEPLAMSGERTWRWVPGFFAGLVAAELRKAGQPIAAYRLEISPHPDKLALPLYRKMLDDLIVIEPMLVLGTEPATDKLGALGSARDPWLEFRRLRMHAPSLLAALQQLTKRPIRNVRSSRQIAPLRAARRIDVQTVRSAAMIGTLAPLVSNGELNTQSSTQKEPNYDLPWFEEHWDGPANRCITAMLLAVQRRTLELLTKLTDQISKSEVSQTRTGLAARWPARLDFLKKLAHDLKLLARDEPFRSVTRPEVSAAGLNAVSAHPVYSRVYRCAWHAIRPGLQHLDASESIWLCPTWEIYERWCFARVVAQLRCLMGTAGQIEWGNARCVWKGKSETGVRVNAHCQLPFRSTETSKFRSISRERRPDIVVTAELGDKRRYMILDAKYRQSRQGVLEAMASAHIYNDSLRWEGQRPWLSLLTVPAGGGAPWLEEREFIESEGVGVLILSPENGTDKLDDLLDRLIEPPQT
ncbi:MAG: hypothetical protein LAT81_15190, partial [Oceanicaulis sp.]|nr:hypothetical protein [Oceanicaulis sp.]